jgi:NAD(P)-dependent dehydrogenase (short-subunit alcohol dehydrogenase family)
MDIQQHLSKDLISEIEDLGSSASYFNVDLSNEESLNETLTMIQKDFGTPDYVINNAGIVTGGMIKDENFKRFKLPIAVNFFAPIQITQFFLDSMIK